jgi:hypothetical protein
MYAASGILILCRWPSFALDKGRLSLASAQDGHLQRMRIPEAAYMYN